VIAAHSEQKTPREGSSFTSVKLPLAYGQRRHFGWKCQR
jgi:hypothetical protein